MTIEDDIRKGTVIRDNEFHPRKIWVAAVIGGGIYLYELHQGVRESDDELRLVYTDDARKRAPEVVKVKRQ